MARITFIAYDPGAHLSYLEAWLTDAAIMRGWGMPAFETSTIAAWAENPSRLILMVKSESDGAIVGMVNFYDWDKGKRTASWGVLIEPRFRNKGFGRAANEASIAHAFNILGLDRIELYVEAGNEASRHLVEKLGYRRERFDEVEGRYHYVMENPKRGA